MPYFRTACILIMGTHQHFNLFFRFLVCYFQKSGVFILNFFIFFVHLCQIFFFLHQRIHELSIFPQKLIEAIFHFVIFLHRGNNAFGKLCFRLVASIFGPLSRRFVEEQVFILGDMDENTEIITSDLPAVTEGMRVRPELRTE